MKTIVLDGDSAVGRLIDWLLRGWQDAAKLKRPLVVMVAHAEEPRTARQVRRYWNLLRQIAEAAEIDGRRFTAEHWDEFFKRQFVGVDELDGHVVALGTSDLSVGEFNDYCERVIGYALGELSIELDLK